ncbi:MAG: 3-hydroxybutyryl-CoA dehydrogenase [Betaproteobacteria bacterium]|jgi:3-hydroxybutyryl-CoA dehydrogenase
MQVRHIGVVGAGTMGSGIAQAFAVAGYDVTMTDVAQAALDRGVKTIDGSLDRLVKKDRMTIEVKASAMDRIKVSTDMETLSSSDLVIEAATENLSLKLDIFSRLDRLARADAILASNTSSISITKLAAATSRPDRVIGMHFFNPVPVMQLVELIRGLQTSDETYAAVEATSRAVGKSPVKVRNSPGFVVNRLLCPMINEAIFAFSEGLASAQEIDDAMRLGCNHPIGPLALCDLIGLDVELAVMQVLFEGFKDPKYRPAPLLIEMVEAGYLGRKTGRGFHSYA